jgi:hypothetical protein
MNATYPIRLYMALHTFHDGSELHRMKARTLLEIPIWKGNRILDVAHVAEIQKAIGSHINHLDSGYSIVQYEELDAANKPVLGTYIIDGQHRAAVLKEHFKTTLCEPDFDILVTQKRVTDEEEAIAFFNAINKCKPQAWKSDPSLLVNKYVAALTKRYNTTKKMLFIRPGATHRPYLSSDKLREQLTLCAANLKQTSREVQEFVERSVKWNTQELGATQMALTLNEIPKKDIPILEKCIDTGFLLAFDPTLKWIRACLEPL